MKFKILFLILLILMPIASASFGVFQKDECINLLQTCATCSYNNISSVSYPDSTIILSESQMTKLGTEYNYTFCNTSILGEYKVNGHGDLDGNKTIWKYSFLVTPNGENPSNASAIFYVIFEILLMTFLIFAIYGIIKTPNNLWGRYGFVSLVYLLLIAISFISWKIASDFITSNSFIAGFLWIVFITLMLGFIPYLFCSFIYLIYASRKIKEISRLLHKGVPYDEAVRRVKVK